MNSFAFLCLCLQVFVVQNVCSQHLGRYPAPALSPLGYAPEPAAPFGYPYGGIGEGNVAVAGELPVAGNTAVVGQVPIMGAVNFGGVVPAAGAVSISGRCDCGSPYEYYY